ncbi:cysteinyl leukotriene receptor 2-like isoform X1 [Hemiscyllium ocellatum]|uniref:cysteinyl leukotriene receptor 2-like isoform X1 n=2 Tax=Hemiscyllium ocellatum TaxID=170820 RepID=UPI0029663C8C|nr:cysteinyl leukotriene receptor 2-like isoform X1 [Hemiscyllium ocellatum]
MEIFFCKKRLIVPIFSKQRMVNDNNNLNNDSCGNITNFKANIYIQTYIIVFIFGFIENVFCLYILLKLYKRNTTFSIVMVNLAISDLLFVCTLPWRVHYYWNNNKWDFSFSFCMFLTYALYLNMYCSIYFLTLMSVLRYFAVVHPMKALKYRSVRSVQIICVAIWVFVGVSTIPFVIKKNEQNDSNTTKCFEPNNGISNENSTMSNETTMNFFSLVVGCIIPFLTISVCYIFVVKTLLTSEVQCHQQKRSRKTAIAMIIIVMIIFLTCFLPYHILRTVYLVTRQNSPSVGCTHKALVVTLCTVATNPCLDPLLYYFAAGNFRGKVRSTIKTTFRGSLALMRKT